MALHPWKKGNGCSLYSLLCIVIERLICQTIKPRSIGRLSQAPVSFHVQLSIRRRKDLQVIDCPSDHETESSFSKLVGDSNFTLDCRINEVHHHLTELHVSFNECALPINKFVTLEARRRLTTITTKAPNLSTACSIFVTEILYVCGKSGILSHPFTPRPFFPCARCCWNSYIRPRIANTRRSIRQTSTTIRSVARTIWAVRDVTHMRG